ncbi:MAG TPA: amino acid permease [Steroidobacteraceae bacterium]|nr:amino acid permease [Steroidobacteraceae bacterium]
MTQKLPRVLRFPDLVLLTLGSVIGSGIFIVPATVLTQTAGSLGLALFVWAAGGILSLLGALTYAELAAMKPESGGLYVFIRDAFGSSIAFLYGWAMILVIASATVATLAVAFAAYLRELTALSPAAMKVAAVVMIIAIAAINALGTRRSANLQNWTTAIKVGAILVMSALLLTRGDGLNEAATELPGVEGSLLTALGAAMLGVLWAYEGWHFITFSAGEVIDPQKNFARGIIIGTAALIGIYLLANVAYVAALGVERSASSERIAAEAVSQILGPGAGKLIALAILISMFSAANAVVLTASRVYFAMARDGLFFQRMASIHPRWQTPAFAIVSSCLWAALLAATGTFEQLLTYVVFTGWAFYALGAAAIFYYRRHAPDTPRPFRAPGYPWTPLAFILTAAAIVLNTVFLRPGQTAIGIGLVLLGVPVHWFWRRKREARAS